MGFRRTVVLVVSDDNECAAEMQQMLGAVGYIPVILTDGSRALESVKSLQPDIILLDLAMKGRSALLRPV